MLGEPVFTSVTMDLGSAHVYQLFVDVVQLFSDFLERFYTLLYFDYQADNSSFHEL
jgi:hypothetical protein